MRKIFCLLCFIKGLWSAPFAYIYPFETPTAKYIQHFEVDECEPGLDSVDCIYVINLDSRPEKWERTKSQLTANGLTAHRFSAVNGWQFSEETIKELLGPYPVRINGRGWIGCLLSHLSVLKNAYDNGFDRIWILEDDVEFLKDVKELPLLLKKLSSIDPEWDIFYTDVDFRDNKSGYIQSVSSDFRPDGTYFPLSYYVNRVQVDQDIIRMGQRFGTRSFFVSRAGMNKILQFFTHVYIWTGIDIDLHYIPGIREYCPTKDIISNQKERIYRDTGNESSLHSPQKP